MIKISLLILFVYANRIIKFFIVSSAINDQICETCKNKINFSKISARGL